MKWRYRINAYYAILMITVAGALAAYTIVHVATNNVILNTKHNSEAQYTALQQSILKNEAARKIQTSSTTP